MIELDTVSKSYDGGSTWAVRDVSLSVRKGEILALLGESGCGKTTTLKMVNRLVDLDKGRILLDGDDIADRNPVDVRRQVGYVFQEIGLFPHMTAAENIGVAPSLMGWSESEINAATKEMFDLTGLDYSDLRQRFPAELSGGQRQRIGVARALAAGSNIVLMDEPFGALDPITRVQMQDDFRALHDKLKLTVILVTHDVTEALTIADRVGVMYRGEIVALDLPEAIISNPQHAYVEAIIKTTRRRFAKLLTSDSEGPRSNG